jgi:hypothetical protein
MYDNVTLSPKDFREIHNALCDLRQTAPSSKTIGE